MVFCFESMFHAESCLHIKTMMYRSTFAHYVAKERAHDDDLCRIHVDLCLLSKHRDAHRHTHHTHYTHRTHRAPHTQHHTTHTHITQSSPQHTQSDTQQTHTIRHTNTPVFVLKRVSSQLFPFLVNTRFALSVRIRPASSLFISHEISRHIELALQENTKECAENDNTAYLFPCNSHGISVLALAVQFHKDTDGQCRTNSKLYNFAKILSEHVLTSAHDTMQQRHRKRSAAIAPCVTDLLEY